MDGRDETIAESGPRDGSDGSDGPDGPDAPDGHVPVLVAESVHYLDLGRGGVVVDCTLGLGGHAEAFLEAGPDVRLLGIDRDAAALRRASRRLERFGDRFEPVHGPFFELERILEERGIDDVAGIFADLGVSSMQLDEPDRGFSFQRNGPLDMRMDPSRGRSAAEVVMTYSQAALEKVLREYGEERQARRIARSIVRRREETPIETTEELRDAVHRAVPPRMRHGRPPRIDPATRTFQALRIEVNQELSGLERLLDQSMAQLQSDGRLVVISYHSLEDRITKSALRAAAKGEVDEVTGSARVETRLIELLTRKPVRPSEREVEANPRSRSARLRAARRL